MSMTVRETLADLADVVIRKWNDRQELGLDCSNDAGRTKQEFAEEANINTLMARWARADGIPVSTKMPQYGDFSDVDSYHEAANKVRAAQREFDSLPAAIRDRMQNDPSKLLEFLADAENLDEAIELGLVEARTVPTENEPAEPAAPVEPTED